MNLITICLFVFDVLGAERQWRKTFSRIEGSSFGAGENEKFTVLRYFLSPSVVTVNALKLHLMTTEGKQYFT